MFVLIGCLLIQMTVGLGDNTPYPERVSPREADLEPVTPAQLAGIKAFYRDCLQISEMGVVRRTPRSQISDHMPSGSLEAEVSYGPDSPEMPDKIGFDPVTGEVYSYGKMYWERDLRATQLSLKDAISEDRAWKQALPVLKHYGLSASRDEYRSNLKRGFFASEFGNDNNLYGFTRNIFRALSYRGTPCRPANIMVQISAQAGKVVWVAYYPVIVPCETQWLVSKAEAAKRAKTWLANSARFGGPDVILDVTNLDRIQKVIAQPNDWFLPKENKAPSETHGKAYYCWEVPYSVYGSSYAVWVRADTGDIIGGWMPY